MKKCGLLILFLFLFGSISFSQISLDSSGYTQDFNTLADTGSSSILPEGWYLYETGSSRDSEYVAGTGATTGGNTYSFGADSSTERALGTLQTSTLVPTIGAKFINNTGHVITLLHITYIGEQWRLGSKTREEHDKLLFSYSLDAAELSDGVWNPASGLDFISPNILGSSTVLDGNLPENQREVNYTITGLSIPDGGTFWIKWSDFNVTSTDDGLAVDDLQIDFNAPSVTFSISPFSLDFDTVALGSSKTLSLAVSNEGASDDLEITNITSSNPVFTFLPGSFPITVSPGDTQLFDIKFTPAEDGPETGILDFVHSAAGSPSSISLSGLGQAPSQNGLLKFKSHVRNLLDGKKDNPDTLLLSGYSGQPLKALQFTLLTGNSNGKLILRSVSRGSAIPAGQFNFSYQINRGSILPDDSSIDTVKVVILGNGTNTIAPNSGDQELMIFSYDIVSISGISVQTTNSITGVTGATAPPVNDADLGAGPDEVINIFNGTLEGLLGDVNLDNQVNILDILLMVDYLLGRAEFSSAQFLNSDIAPWEAGEFLPTRDGVIDVLDLAVLQDIILKNTYPSNAPLYKINFNLLAAKSAAKLTPGIDAKVTFYFTAEGISIGMESTKKIKGLQAELSKTGLIPQSTAMSSYFSQALYYQENSFLRMISYDEKCTSLNPGEYIIASIPFNLVDPENIKVENVIVADDNNNAMQKLQVEIQYQNPNVPINYMLSQNYPNPFNPNTLIKYSIPKDEFVTIKIYNIIGQEVAKLFSQNSKAGTYTLSWDGKDHEGKLVSSGTYIYRMTAGEYTESKKMMYIK